MPGHFPIVDDAVVRERGRGDVTPRAIHWCPFRSTGVQNNSVMINSLCASAETMVSETAKVSVTWAMAMATPVTMVDGRWG